MKTTIYSPDIECDSCIKVLQRALKNNKDIKKINFQQDAITIEHKNTVKKTDLLKTIKQKGYRASFEPHMKLSIKERTKDFLTNKQKYAIEYKMLKYMGISAIILFILEVLLVLGIDRLKPGFAYMHWPWILYLTISVIFITAAIWHYKAYKSTVTCMTGMMIGMTIGMQTGMLIGAVFGATNGFFVGAMVGMILGVVVGAWSGNCCGVMGVMEGMMAGVMGGTMGAMITVMMFTDHIHWFMPVYLIFNIIILIGFSYMLFEELVEGKQVQRTPAGFTKFFVGALLILVALTILMALAPKSIFMMGGM